MCYEYAITFKICVRCHLSQFLEVDSAKHGTEAEEEEEEQRGGEVKKTGRNNYEAQ